MNFLKFIEILRVLNKWPVEEFSEKKYLEFS